MKCGHTPCYRIILASYCYKAVVQIPLASRESPRRFSASNIPAIASLKFSDTTTSLDDYDFITLTWRKHVALNRYETFLPKPKSMGRFPRSSRIGSVFEYWKREVGFELKFRRYVRKGMCRKSAVKYQQTLK